MNSKPPLVSFSRFLSNNLDETRHNVSTVFCPHKLEVKGGGQQLATQVHEATFGHSALVYITYGTTVCIDTECLGHCFLVQIPWRGSAEVVTSSHTGVFRPGMASMISPTQSMRMQWSNDCSFYTVRLDRHRVEKKLTQLLGHELHAPLVFDPHFDLSTPEGESWVNAVEFARQQLELPLQADKAGPVSQQLEDTLCLMLLQLPAHSYTAQLHNAPTDLAPKTIKRAREYIRDNIQQQIPLQSLAASTGVAPATLTKHFRHYLGQTPTEYIRSEKLAAVHLTLSKVSLETSVTDIALQYGFNHLGRFAKYYHQRYGERPSDTLKQLKKN